MVVWESRTSLFTILAIFGFGAGVHLSDLPRFLHDDNRGIVLDGEIRRHHRWIERLRRSR